MNFSPETVSLVRDFLYTGKCDLNCANFEFVAEFAAQYVLLVVIIYYCYLILLEVSNFTIASNLRR